MKNGYMSNVEHFFKDIICMEVVEAFEQKKDQILDIVLKGSPRKQLDILWDNVFSLYTNLTSFSDIKWRNIDYLRTDMKIDIIIMGFIEYRLSKNETSTGLNLFKEVISDADIPIDGRYIKFIQKYAKIYKQLLKCERINDQINPFHLSFLYPYIYASKKGKNYLFTTQLKILSYSLINQYNELPASTVDSPIARRINGLIKFCTEFDLNCNNTNVSKDDIILNRYEAERILHPSLFTQTWDTLMSFQNQKISQELAKYLLNLFDIEESPIVKEIDRDNTIAKKLAQLQTFSLLNKLVAIPGVFTRLACNSNIWKEPYYNVNGAHILYISQFAFPALSNIYKRMIFALIERKHLVSNNESRMIESILFQEFGNMAEKYLIDSEFDSFKQLCNQERTKKFKKIYDQLRTGSDYVGHALAVNCMDVFYRPRPNMMEIIEQRPTIHEQCEFINNKAKFYIDDQKLQEYYFPFSPLVLSYFTNQGYRNTKKKKSVKK